MPPTGLGSSTLLDPVALDRTDHAVGPLRVLPGSHHAGLAELEEADTSISFTPIQARRAEGSPDPVEIEMAPGDVLFFNSLTIHGSLPNTTHDRWRRAWVCHYRGTRSEPFDPPPMKHFTTFPGLEKYLSPH